MSKLVDELVNRLEGTWDNPDKVLSEIAEDYPNLVPEDGILTLAEDEEFDEKILVCDGCGVWVLWRDAESTYEHGDICPECAEEYALAEAEELDEDNEEY